MGSNKWKDELTPLERAIYRWISYLALAVVFCCVFLLRKHSPSTITFAIGIFALLIAMVFGGGYSKSVRVLDLRRFDKHSD